MGCWDIFCPICGLPLGYNIIDSIKKMDIVVILIQLK